MGVTRFETRGTAEARKTAEKHLDQAQGFVLLTWGPEGDPVMNCGGVSRAELAYMACYLTSLAVSADLESDEPEYDA